MFAWWPDAGKARSLDCVRLRMGLRLRLRPLKAAACAKNPLQCDPVAQSNGLPMRRHPRNVPHNLSGCDSHYRLCEVSLLPVPSAAAGYPSPRLCRSNTTIARILSIPASIAIDCECKDHPTDVHVCSTALSPSTPCSPGATSTMVAKYSTVQEHIVSLIALAGRCPTYTAACATSRTF
jgi:hypothetical protein